MSAKIMFRIQFLRFALFLLFISPVFAQNDFPLYENTVVKLVDGDRAKQLVMTEDEYTIGMTKFDLQSKTQRTDSVTVNDYMKFSAEQVVKWTDDEKKIMQKVVESVSKKIKTLGLTLHMPAEIEVIKSTMENEGGASGYTRGSYIVLKEGSMSSYSERLENLFMHELFHVLSRYHTPMSEAVYKTLGFKKCNEVPYPPEIKDLRISNPDAVWNNFYITVQYKGKPVDVMLILFAKKPYNGGSFFSYLQIGLMVVSGSEDDKEPVYVEGKPLILKAKDVTGFYEQVGKNTDYIFHAEEISADHFVMLLNQEKDLPNPELIEAMKSIMK
jgi:hypothetical protein